MLDNKILKKIKTFTFLFLSIMPIFLNATTLKNRDHFLSSEDFHLYINQPYDLNLFTNKNWNPDDSLFDGQIQCNFSKCISLDDAVSQTLKNGFPTREKLEILYRSRQQVISKIGKLLPRIEFSLGVGVNPTNILNTVSNLVGFMLPSNWFSWKESILFYEAEKNSYIGLLQDQISNTEILYYNIHRINFDILVYQYYIKHIDELLKYIRTDSQNRNTIKENDLLELENFIAELTTESATLSGIIKEIDEYDLATSIVYPDMSSIGILPISLPNLSLIKPLEASEKDLKTVLSRSKELFALRNLKQASNYSRYSRLFSILGGLGSGDETSLGISFGLDTVADIKISKSERRSIEDKIQERTLLIEKTYRKAIDAHNISIDLYNQYIKAKIPNRSLFHSVLTDYKVNGNLDVDLLIKSIRWALKFELGRNFVQHYYLTTRSQIDRLLVSGPRYETLSKNQSIPKNKPLHFWNDRIKLSENQKINNDILQGKLDLNNP